MKLNPKLLDRMTKEVNKSPSRYRHVAVALDRRGNVITAACNRGDAHAEHRLMQKYFSTAKFYGKGVSSILVARIANGGTWGQSKPCVRCQTLLGNLGVNVMHS